MYYCEVEERLKHGVSFFVLQLKSENVACIYLATITLIPLNKLNK